MFSVIIIIVLQGNKNFIPLTVCAFLSLFMVGWLPFAIVLNKEEVYWKYTPQMLQSQLSIRISFGTNLYYSPFDMFFRMIDT